MFAINGLKVRHLLLVAMLFSWTVMIRSCAKGDNPTPPSRGAKPPIAIAVGQAKTTPKAASAEAVTKPVPEPDPTTANIVDSEDFLVDLITKRIESLRKVTGVEQPEALAIIKKLEKTLKKLQGEKKVAGFHPVTPAPLGKSTLCAEKVHVIIAADTREKTASGTDNWMRNGAIANATMMKNLLYHELGQHEKVIQLQEFCYPEFDHERIMTAINGLQTSKSGNDTIFVYISCQAGADQNSLLVPYWGRNDAVVARKTYLDCMRNKSTRQCVLVTDTWGSVPAENAAENAADQVLPTSGQTPTHLLSALLLHQRGVYDFGGSRPPVSSGAPGEVCVLHNDGGLFTHAFFDASVYCQDTREGWASLFQDAAHRMPKGMITFQGGTTQQGQHPHVFSVR